MIFQQVGWILALVISHNLILVAVDGDMKSEIGYNFSFVEMIFAWEMRLFRDSRNLKDVDMAPSLIPTEAIGAYFIQVWNSLTEASQIILYHRVF